MPDDLDITKYFECVDEASTRSRWVVYILVAASIVAFFGFWNARDWSWASEELKRVDEIETYYPWSDGVLEGLQKAGKREEVSAFERSRSYAKLQKFEVAGTPARGAVESDKTTPKRQERMEKHRERLLKQLDEHTIVKLPIFNVSIETNDLGLFSGLTFVIVLSMLAYCLKSELRNLRMALREAQRRNRFSEVYDYLAMTQVLTVPNENGRPPTWYWVWPQLGLYFLPLLVQAFGAYLDWKSRDVGLAISRFNTDFTTAYEIFFLVWISWLSILCCRLSYDNDRMWRRKGREATTA